MIIDLCSTFATPFLMTTIILNSNWRQFVDTDDTAKSLINGMWVVQLVQTILVLFICFVSSYNEQNPISAYSSCMPKFQYACAFVLILVSPCVNIGIYLAMLGSDAETGAIFGYVTFCTLLVVFVMVWFFANLLDDFLLLKINLQKVRQVYLSALGVD